MKQPRYDKSYEPLVHRFNELYNKTERTWLEQQELEAINRKLEAQELGTVRAIVDDYEETMQLYEAGNLGQKVRL